MTEPKANDAADGADYAIGHDGRVGFLRQIEGVHSSGPHFLKFPDNSLLNRELARRNAPGRSRIVRAHPNCYLIRCPWEALRCS
jgi:hypothetical protein